MEIKLTLENAKELEAVFRRAPGIALKEYRTSLERIATNVLELAQKNAPVNKGEAKPKGKRGYGGNLRQSIKKYPYGSTGFMVRVEAEYGIYVDQGTKPHIILPKNKPYLVFKTRDGKWVRAKRVNHPGTKAQPFFTNAVKDTESYANREMSAAMDRVLNQLK